MKIQLFLAFAVLATTGTLSCGGSTVAQHGPVERGSMELENSSQEGCVRTGTLGTPRAIRLVEERAEASGRLAGVALRDGCTIVVYMKGVVDGQTEKSLRKLAGEAPLEVKSVARDADELAELHARVKTMSGALADRGIEVFGFWPDFTTGFEVVSIRRLTPAKARIVKDVLGPGVSVTAAPVEEPILTSGEGVE